jgi:diguanylate cyclase (GGDEF)-like protein
MPITPLDASLIVLATGEAAVAAFLMHRQILLRKLAERVARESQERTVEIQRLARIGNWEYDIVTEQIRWSDETFHIFGRTPGSQEPDFADILLAIHPEDSPVFDRAIERAINNGESYYLDVRIRLPDGTQKDIHAQGSPVCDKQGRALRLIGTFLDITDRKRLENKLAVEATVDPLTGLANRRWVLSELARGVGEALESHSPYSFCICDVDRFKNINDTYGHHAGDEVLKAAALAIRAELRGQDLPGRLGGDEFCILLPRTTPAHAQICVERIRRRLQAVAFADGAGRSYGVTATFGIAGLFPGMTEAALFEAADQALYAAKRRNGNAVEVAV